MKRQPRSFQFHINSVRTRLMLWNVSILAVILAALGGTIHYTVKTNLLASVDRELLSKAPPPPPRDGRPYPPPDRPPAERTDDNPPRGEERPPEDSINPPRTGPPGSKDFGSGQEEPADNALNDPRQQEGDRPPQDRNNRRPRISPLNGGQYIRRYPPVTFDLAGHGTPPHRGELILDYPAFQLALHARESLKTISSDDGDLRVYTKPLGRNGKVEAVFQYAHPLKELESAIDGMNQTLLTLIPLALVLAGVGGAMLTHRALRPVREITRTAEQIGMEDLSRRLPAVGKDEFSSLATTINNMLHRLQSGFNEKGELVRQLEILIEQQRRFTGDASHELRTPLTIIKANASLALRGTPSLPEYRDSMEEIDRAANRMSRLVQDLLLLTKADGGQIGHCSMALPLLQLVQRVVTCFQSLGDGAVITVDIPESLAVLGNADELERLVSNLLENALRYTPPDGKIHIEAEALQNFASLRISDTGIGIAPEHLPHLGERFYRSDVSRSRPDGGAGLGISICKSIVEAHRGTISIDSVVGSGTTVTIKIPRPA